MKEKKDTQSLFSPAVPLLVAVHSVFNGYLQKAAWLALCLQPPVNTDALLDPLLVWKGEKAPAGHLAGCVVVAHLAGEEMPGLCILRHLCHIQLSISGNLSVFFFLFFFFLLL